MRVPAQTDIVLMVRNGGEQIESVPISQVPRSAHHALFEILPSHGTVLTTRISEKLCAWATDDLGREIEPTLIKKRLGGHVDKGYWLMVEYTR